VLKLLSFLPHIVFAVLQSADISHSLESADAVAKTVSEDIYAV